MMNHEEYSLLPTIANRKNGVENKKLYGILRQKD